MSRSYLIWRVWNQDSSPSHGHQGDMPSRTAPKQPLEPYLAIRLFSINPVQVNGTCELKSYAEYTTLVHNYVQNWLVIALNSALCMYFCMPQIQW